MVRPITTGCLCACVLLTAAAASAQVTFQKIADTDSAFFGGAFSEPTIHGDAVAFRAYGSNHGIYVGSGGPITTIADFTTVVPESVETFSGFNLIPVISDGGVVFVGVSDGFAGIYLATDQGIEKVADRNTPHPGGGGALFIQNMNPNIGGAVVTFIGASPTRTTNIFRYSQGLLEVAVDENSSLPGGSGPLFFELPVANEGETLAIRAAHGTEGNSVYGLWRMSDSAVEPVIEAGDLLPPAFNETYAYLSPPAIGSGTVAFVADNVTSSGVYADSGGGLLRIADRTTTVPGSSETFLGFHHVSADGDTVAFGGYSTLSTGGVFAWHRGKLMKVAVTGDSIDGKGVVQVYLSRNAVSGNRVAFRVWFEDSSVAVYAATLPDTSTPVPGISQSGACGLVLGLAVLGVVRLGRRGSVR